VRCIDVCLATVCFVSSSMKIIMTMVMTVEVCACPSCIMQI